MEEDNKSTNIEGTENTSNGGNYLLLLLLGIGLIIIGIIFLPLWLGDIRVYIDSGDTYVYGIKYWIIIRGMLSIIPIFGGIICLIIVLRKRKSIRIAKPNEKSARRIVFAIIIILIVVLMARCPSGQSEYGKLSDTEKENARWSYIIWNSIHGSD